MKKLLLNLLLLCVALQSYAQYRPMLTENAQWFSFYSFEQSVLNINYRVNGDTTINDTILKKLMLSYDEIDYYEAFLREDTILKKIFINDDGGIEEVLYDYSLQVGDSFAVPYVDDEVLILDSITHNIKYLPFAGSNPILTIFDSTLNVFYFHPVGFFIRSVVWVESIGSLQDFLQVGSISEQHCLICHYNGQSLRDYLYIPYVFEYDTAQINSVSKDCVVLTNVGFKNDEDNEFSFSIYPNPTKGTSIINYEIPPETKFAEIWISDLHGKTIEKQRISVYDNAIEIDFSHLKANTYLFTLYADGKVKHSKRIIVEK